MNSYKIFFDEFQILLISEDIEVSAEKKMIMHAGMPEDIEPLVFLIKNHLIKTDVNVICADPKAVFSFFKKKFLFINAAGGIVKNSSNELLFIYKQNHWDLPKGKIDRGEKKKAAAMREVTEECGISKLEITAKVAKTYHVAKLRSRYFLKKTNWYEMICSDPDNLKPDAGEGITDLKWINPNRDAKIADSLYRSLKDLILPYLHTEV
jgi:8-oxo-dGTP pyrophosphatase MutT (NUDIX family)